MRIARCFLDRNKGGGKDFRLNCKLEKKVPSSLFIVRDADSEMFIV